MLTRPLAAGAPVQLTREIAICDLPALLEILGLRPPKPKAPRAAKG